MGAGPATNINTGLSPRLASLQLPVALSKENKERLRGLLGGKNLRSLPNKGENHGQEEGENEGKRNLN